MQNIYNPKHWRERAEEARSMAESFDDPKARAQMLEVAAGYERLAKMIEETKPEKPRKS